MLPHSKVDFPLARDPERNIPICIKLAGGPESPGAIAKRERRQSAAGRRPGGTILARLLFAHPDRCSLRDASQGAIYTGVAAGTVWRTDDNADKSAVRLEVRNAMNGFPDWRHSRLTQTMAS